MKRTTGAIVAITALVVPGAATAKTIQGTKRANLLVGTIRPDTVLARAGDDRIAVQQGGRDRVSCGTGRDVVTADAADRIGSDCEVVSRQLSRDRLRSTAPQHETQVEPDSFSHGSTTVAVFQSARFYDGGAGTIGFATSTNGGRSWRSGFLPGLTFLSPRPGPATRVSDPAVTYDATHRVWLAVSLALAPSFTTLLVSRSADGLRWEGPVTAARSAGASLAYDKEWITCDNWQTSPFGGRCYLSYTDVPGRRIVTQASSDGGRTWSAAVGSPSETLSDAVGAQPVVRPDGALIVAFADRPGITYVQSSDGGATFSQAQLVAPGRFRNVPGVRATALPSAEATADGSVYVTWHECGRRSGCTGNDVLLSVSRDGAAWSPPSRIPTGSAAAGFHSFAPDLAGDPASPPRLALFYYSLGPCACSLAAWILSSADGGATWSRRQRLSAQPLRPGWFAKTPGGAFAGDYFSVSFTAGRPVPVFVVAARPLRGSLRQAVFATVRGAG